MTIEPRLDHTDAQSSQDRRPWSRLRVRSSPARRPCIERGLACRAAEAAAGVRGARRLSDAGSLGPPGPNWSKRSMSCSTVGPVRRPREVCMSSPVRGGHVGLRPRRRQPARARGGSAHGSSSRDAARPSRSPQQRQGRAASAATAQAEGRRDGTTRRCASGGGQHRGQPQRAQTASESQRVPEEGGNSLKRPRRGRRHRGSQPSQERQDGARTDETQRTKAWVLRGTSAPCASLPTASRAVCAPAVRCLRTLCALSAAPEETKRAGARRRTRARRVRGSALDPQDVVDTRAPTHGGMRTGAHPSTLIHIYCLRSDLMTGGSVVNAGSS